MSGLLARVTGHDRPAVDAEADCSLDEALDVLSNKRRRRVVRYVAGREVGEIVTIGELADHLAKLETEGTVLSQDRKRAYVGLHQAHRDQLVDADVLSPAPDEEANAFRAGSNAEPLAEYLDVVADATRGDRGD